MWQSVVRPLLRITSMSKILFLFFFLPPFFWKSAFEFWKRCNTFDWGVILFDLALAQLQRWGNFLKLATMKVFHEEKSSKPARWKVLSKTFKGLSQMKDWGKWVWIYHSYFGFRNVLFSFHLDTDPISQCKKSSSTSLFFVLDCWFTFDKWYVDIICYPATSSKVVPTFVDDQDSRKWKNDPKNVKPLDIF